MNVTEELSAFAAKIQYDDLPPAVIRESKRLLLDTIGCAVGGIKTKKGILAIQLAQSLGGAPESSLFGGNGKVSAASSAYALGELMNALDYEALLSPPDHATPYVLAAPLAVGEAKKITGRECITVCALAHEIATRIASGLIFGRRFNMQLPGKGVVMALPTPGYGLCIFAGTATAGRILGLNSEKIAQAMGIAGYQAPIPMLMKFSTLNSAVMPKYLSAGLLSQQEVMAAVSADIGYDGDTSVLDGDYGFWRAFGCDGWQPERITDELGKTWHFPRRLFFKIFPCCGAMQNTLALFQDMIKEHQFAPGEISELRVKLNLLAALPLWKNNQLNNHIDAQFNVPFVFSALANGIEVGPAWQTEEVLTNRGIQMVMKKVRVITDPGQDFSSVPDVEVIVGTDSDKKTFSRSGMALGYELSDDILSEKFLTNCRPTLGNGLSDRALSMLLSLEDLDDINSLFDLLNKKPDDKNHSL